MAYTYSKMIANNIKEFLREDGRNYSFDEKDGVFRFRMNLEKCKIQTVWCMIIVYNDSYLFCALPSIGVDTYDKKTMLSMAEFICRANQDSFACNFELDMSDGRIVFRNYTDCDGILPSHQMISSSIYIPELMFEEYGDGIVDVIHGHCTAESAIYRCKHKQDLPKKFSEMYEEIPDEDSNNSGDQSDGGEE